MLYYVPALLMLLDLTACFPREKTTQKPEVPPVVNTKHSRPTHISEFTDPDTGHNPFVDLVEGQAPSMSRNVMEDERRVDEDHYFDLDLVEGDASDRRWNLPKENLGRIPGRRPELDYKDENEFPVRTTPLILPNPPTTVELPITKGIEHAKTEVVGEGEEIPREIIKEEEESFVISQSSVIYATATIAVMTIIILLAGACWWRRKLKTTRSTSTAESAEVKS